MQETVSGCPARGLVVVSTSTFCQKEKMFSQQKMKGSNCRVDEMEGHLAAGKAALPLVVFLPLLYALLCTLCWDLRGAK